jgi:S-adenosylmethionine/arginine decarboxylase-like enzyme
MNYNHLTIDAFGCENTNNWKFLETFLVMCAKKAKMNLLKRHLNGVKPVNPQIYAGSKNLPGYTGSAIIETSHICIHNFPKDNNKINFDIYSCRRFSNAKIINFFKECFKPKTVIVKGIKRF